MWCEKNELKVLMSPNVPQGFPIERGAHRFAVVFEKVQAVTIAECTELVAARTGYPGC